MSLRLAVCEANASLRIALLSSSPLNQFPTGIHVIAVNYPDSRTLRSHLTISPLSPLDHPGTCGFLQEVVGTVGVWAYTSSGLGCWFPWPCGLSH